MLNEIAGVPHADCMHHLHAMQGAVPPAALAMNSCFLFGPQQAIYTEELLALFASSLDTEAKATYMSRPLLWTWRQQLRKWKRLAPRRKRRLG